MGTIVFTSDGRGIINPTSEELRKAFPKQQPVLKKVKLPGPKIFPGYVNDLLARMASKESLPAPEGKSGSSEYSVSWQAYRESERLDDLAILPELAQRVDKAKSSNDFSHLAHMLCCLFENTKSPTVAELLARFLNKVPDKPLILDLVFFSLSMAPTAKVRVFALKHIPHKSWSAERDALHVLKAAADPEDFPMLSELLFSGRLHEDNLWHCIQSLASCGEKRALPLLKQFIEANKKSRKGDYKYAVQVAEDEIGRLS
jgi:hypothetical protein